MPPMSAETQMAALVAPALANLLKSAAPVPLAVQAMAAEIAARPGAPTFLGPVLAARADLHPTVAASLLAGRHDATVAALASNAVVDASVVCAAVGVIASAHRLSYLAATSSSVPALTALATRVRTSRGGAHVYPAFPGGPTPVGVLSTRERACILTALMENPVLPEHDALVVVREQLGRARGDVLAQAFPNTVRRPALAATLAWLADHPRACEQLAEASGAHPAVLVAAARHDARRAAAVLTGVLLPAMATRAGSLGQETHCYRQAASVVTALVATLDAPARAALAGARPDWDTYAGGVVADLLATPPEVLDNATTDALMMSAGPDVVLALARSWRPFDSAHPSAEALRAFLARPDVDAPVAAAVAAVFDPHCHHVLDARPGDVGYLAALYARSPGRMADERDVDVLLATVRLLAAAGGDQLAVLHPDVLERLAARVLELDWVALTPLLGRCPVLDTAVAQLLGVLLGDERRVELFRATAPAFTGPLGVLPGVFTAALAAPARPS